MKTYYVDGGAFIEPPKYKSHDAYLTVVDDTEELLHFDKDLGDIYSGLAEYMAIKWVVDNIKERPIRITSDCQTAMAWAKHLTKASRRRGISPLDLTGITLEYEHNNLADQWNARNHSPKYDKAYYVQRWKETGKKSKTLSKLEAKENTLPLVFDD
jgi:hypothetical protein